MDVFYNTASEISYLRGKLKLKERKKVLGSDTGVLDEIIILSSFEEKKTKREKRRKLIFFFFGSWKQHRKGNSE